VLSSLAILFLCPKLALLPPLLVVAEQLVSSESIRRSSRTVGGYVGGVAVAVALFAVHLAWHGIDIDQTTQLLVRYNAISNANLGTRFGLFQTIVAGGPLTWITVAGIATWAFAHLRARSRPDAYLLALTAWLAIQAIVVAYPYKQYFAPWFLFASIFPG